ncbi:MAG: Signal transduction histidine-protein kinase BaeS [Firmicutes bacterium ADurb.Bin182]|nr:MAG: Signal transduction histidine-protein kinase BaeS [Firmicutes bacterium ADurb.Bin182]
MKLSLGVKLTASFLVVTSFWFAAFGVLANLVLERQFRKYVIEDQERKNGELVNLLQSRYKSLSGWNESDLESIGVSMLSEGLILRVRDAKGNMLWDAMAHNMGFCTAMLEDMAKNMQRIRPGFKGGYTERSYTLSSGNAVIGSVDIGFYGPYYYSDSDVRYLRALNVLLVWTAAACALFAMLLGAGMARRLTTPIGHVIKAAKKIAKGEYADRIREKSGTVEISELTGSINLLAESLERQEIIRKRLTGDIAHELRTPLATLQSHLEAMIDGVWEPDKERLASLHEETLRLNKLTYDLEKLARYDSEKMILEKKGFDLAQLIKRIVTNFQSVFLADGISLKYFTEPLEITADEDKISQVLVNLIANAQKFTGRGGEVKITLTKKEETAEVSVSDTGQGISEKDLPYIFERFYRADPSRSRTTGRSGIGLAIAKAIVLAHKGSITVKSEEGRGTVFTVELPIK